MPLLLCDGFSIDPDGVISCTGETATITLEEVRDSPASGVTLDQANELLAAALLVLSIAFVFSLILRQLR